MCYPERVYSKYTFMNENSVFVIKMLREHGKSGDL